MRRFLSLIVASGLLVSSAGELKAEIAVLANGRSLKVDRWSFADDRIELSLRGGGILAMPVESLDRIVDDEVVMPEEILPLAESMLFPARSWRYDELQVPLFRSPFDELIVEAARKFDVDAALVSAVIKAESDYRPSAVSHKGAQGLMQLMPATARRFGVTDAFDPAANIYAGTRYLRWLLDEFGGNPELALAGYNAGEGNVRKYEGVPPFRETVNYVRKISGYVRDTPPVAMLARN